MTNGNRKRIRLALIGAAAVTIVTLASCQMGTSIQGRIDNFNTQLKNGQYDQLYTNWASNTNTYSVYKSSTAWNSTPFGASNSPSSISLTSTSNASNVTGTFSNNNGSYSVTLVMVEQGNSWYISSMTLTPAGGGTPDVYAVEAPTRTASEVGVAHRA